MGRIPTPIGYTDTNADAWACDRDIEFASSSKNGRLVLLARPVAVRWFVRLPDGTERGFDSYQEAAAALCEEAPQTWSMEKPKDEAG